MRSYPPLITLLPLICLGCVTVGPKYTPPSLDAPCEWHSEPAVGMGEEKELDCFVWWESLQDPVLDSLIERAASQNLDLYIAANRILEARLEKKGGDASLYPHLDGSAAYGHVQYNQKTLDHIVGCENHKASNHKNLNFFEVGFDAEWEIDFFGKQAHEIEALKAKIEASKEEFSQLWVTLSADVARNYIELRHLQQQLEVIDKNITDQKDHLKLTQSLIQAGFAGANDERQAEEQLNTLVAEKPQIVFGIYKAIHRLSILLGYPPGELFAELNQPAALPCLPEEMPLGIPSELLRRRPDIRKAERDLAAATERVGSAVAARFPRISLSGFIGELGTLHSNGLAWFAGPQLLTPIFNSKMLKQDVEFNKIQAQQAMYEYQKTVLSALEEAENAIASFRYEWERNIHLREALQSSRKAYELTDQLYKKGFKSYFDVLIANRSRLTAEEAYLQSQSDLLLHYISLYKALGGAWNNSSQES
jgi:outer membrane protein, multidrug efflux system